MKQSLLVLLGACIGGALGYFAFCWLVGQGFYALALPGGLLGLGAGIAKCRALWPACVCGLLAIMLGIVSEWHFFPFATDERLSFFLRHLHNLKPVTLILIAVGGVIGFWVPFRRRRSAQHTH